MEKMSLCFEEKAYKLKERIKQKFTSNREKRLNWKLQKTITAQKRLKYTKGWKTKMISYKNTLLKRRLGRK